MRRIMCVGLGICISAWICLAAPLAQQRTARTITVQVTDKATGEPIAEAEVSNGSESAKTNEYGQCTVSAPISGFLYLTISHEGYATMGCRWEHIGNGERLPEQLNVAAEIGSAIGGKVVDEGGQPVANAMVRLMGASEDVEDGSVYAELRDSVRTDASGKWSTHSAPASLRGWKSIFVMLIFTITIYFVMARLLNNCAMGPP